MATLPLALWSFLTRIIITSTIAVTVTTASTPPRAATNSDDDSLSHPDAAVCRWEELNYTDIYCTNCQL